MNFRLLSGSRWLESIAFFPKRVSMGKILTREVGAITLAIPFFSFACVNPQPRIESRFLPTDLSEPRNPEQVVDIILLHFISNVVEKPEDPYVLKDVLQLFHDYEVSAHYLIDRQGRIFQLVEEERMARHAGKGQLPAYPKRRDRLNHSSIGIELMGIGSGSDMRHYLQQEEYARLNPAWIGFTAEQYQSLAVLIQDLCARYSALSPDRRHIFGHDEYAPQRRTDPGELFSWNHLMELLQDPP